MKEKDIANLQHTTWRCQYHVVFAPKCRRMAIYGQIKKDIGQILRTLCDQKGVEIIEAQACPDHIHMLLSIPPKYSVSQIMGYLKGKSSLMIFDRHANLKYMGTGISGQEDTTLIRWGETKGRYRNTLKGSWMRTRLRTR